MRLKWNSYARFWWVAAPFPVLAGLLSSSCDGRSPPPVATGADALRATMEAQVEEYEAHLEAGRRQIAETDRQLAQSAEHMRVQAGQLERFDKLLDKWSEKAERVDRLLERWERLTDVAERQTGNLP